MIGIVIVLYNPDSNIYEKLQRFILLSDYLIVIDNSEGEIHEELKNSLSNTNTDSGLCYFGDGVNKGISSALNIGVQECIKKNCEYIFTFDQDSDIESNNYFSNMANELLNKRKKYFNMAMLVPDIIDENAPRNQYQWLIKTTKRRIFYRRKILSELNKDESILVAITSGTLFHCSCFKIYGFFEEKYFIDYVDTEYCLRVTNKGGLILPSSTEKIFHHLGEREEHSLLGKHFYPTNHSYLRRYYIARNSIDMWCRYPMSNPDWALFDLAASIYNLFRIVLFEKNKVKKMLYSLRGFKDGIIGNYGKLK